MTAPVLVTGAGGYLGPHVVESLLDRGHSVTAVVRPGSGATLDPRADVLEIDVLSEEFATDIPTASGIVHLAWQDGFAHNSPAHMMNVSAHFRLLTAAAAAGVPRIVALGTMHEVGYWEGAIDAATPTAPMSQYGIAKDALRKSLAQAISATTSFTWARCFYIFGDDRRNNSIFARVLDAADAGKRTFPFTTGTNKFDFIEVSELGVQIAALFGAPDATGIVNCCTGVPVSLADKVEEFIAQRGLDISLEYGAFPDRPYDSPAIWGDAERINEIVSRASTS
ncbi:epimerase [Microbacterium sp. B35-04]|uniref:NAD-dependent epimerase/dehydratase family protein n=1 Tax=Microbacterium sp. B35-04 TaxID=1961716 RepID=UPI0013D81EC3|nr:NAD-dependent epimerase/dehydratase family protein [Microbacterium sp. B35-04]KAF2412165.1 epimerase [Microbacterium sp. B35-04]